MNERAGEESRLPPDDAGRDASVDSVVDEAGRQLRAPWAASIAGLLFAVLFTAALGATGEELAHLRAEIAALRVSFPADVL